MRGSEAGTANAAVPTHVIAFDVEETITVGEELGHGTLTAAGGAGHDEDVVLGPDGHVGGRLGGTGRGRSMGRRYWGGDRRRDCGGIVKRGRLGGLEGLQHGVRK